MKKNYLIIFVFSIIVSISSILKAEDISLGVDLGFGFIDIGADDTAQTIANISGSTVTASYSSAASDVYKRQIYGEYKIADGTYLDIGLFQTGDVTAKYTLSGATASESYSANGVDVSAVIKENDTEGLFVKGGIHSSTIDGNANVTISGTTYAAQATASGTGFLVGGGYDYADGQRAGITYYSNLGGDSAADMWLIYYGFLF